MEIIIQTKKNFWHIGFPFGVRRVNAPEWKKAMETFEVLMVTKLDKLKKDYASSHVKKIDEWVEKGAKNAPKTTANWWKKFSASWSNTAE